jgi:tetratricopeptide (TPR) repeat protein
MRFTKVAKFRKVSDHCPVFRHKTNADTISIAFLQKGIDLSPTEPAPWSNISAAYFELGDYVQAISACDTALALLASTDTDSDAAKQKLVTRKAKSYYFAGL